MSEIPKRVKSEIELVFSNKELRLPVSLAMGFISHLDEPEDRLFWMNDWLGQQSKHDPENILLILEALFQKLKQIPRLHLFHSEGLIAAAINILRHADLIGDEALISRAIAVQDELIQLNVDKMESVLEDSARA